MNSAQTQDCGTSRDGSCQERLCKQTPVARQWLGDRHVIVATVAHATTAKLLEAVISVRSVPRIYNSDPAAMKGCEPVKGDGLEAAVGEFSPGANRCRKYQLKPVVRGWRGMVARLRGREPGSRRTSAFGSRYQTT
jgi:hypothetical protein